MCLFFFVSPLLQLPVCICTPTSWYPFNYRKCHSEGPHPGLCHFLGVSYLLVFSPFYFKFFIQVEIIKCRKKK